MNKVLYYLAAPFGEKEEARRVRERMNAALGWECTSTWIDNHNTDFAALSDGSAVKEAHADIDDLFEAECMVFLNLGVSEGKMFELGVAISDGIPIYFIGKPTHIFHHLVPSSNRFESVEAFVESVGEKGYGFGV